MLRQNSTPENKCENGWSFVPDGKCKELLSFSFDIITLDHVLNDSKDLLCRLRNSQQYQGARYELAIASVFARLDFQIEFLDETIEDKSISRVEFIATHRPSGFVCCVEAKSKSRNGVIHVPGVFNPDSDFKGNIHNLIKDALKKPLPQDLPYFIFVDLNLPLTPGLLYNEKPWMKEVYEMIEKNPEFVSGTSHHHNAIFVTNFGNYFLDEQISIRPEQIKINHQAPKHEVKNMYYSMLGQALNNYGRVPNIKPNE